MTEENKKADNAQADEAEKEKEEQASETKENCSNDEKKENPTAGENSEDEALNTKYLRLMADFQNYKRRTEKEKSDIYAFANEKIVKELLDVIDNFERALEAGNDGDKFLEGMEMILKQLQGVLEKAGVAEIKCLGEEFDPNFHNAVMHVEDENLGENVIAETFQQGFQIGDKVIRHAMVKVAN